MNRLKKGPDLKLSDLKVPDFVHDLYLDLKERHLLPLVALLLVAIVAAPIYFKNSSEPSPAAQAPPVATGASPEAAQAGLVVARSEPGLRNFKRRLKGARALDPFAQKGGGGASSSESSSGEEASESTASSSSSAATVEVPAEATVTGEESSSAEITVPVEESTGFPEGSRVEAGSSGGRAEGGSGKARPRYESSAVDVHIVTAAAGSSAQEQKQAKSTKPRARIRRNLPELTMLPARSTPAATFMGTSRDGKKALMLVSSDVVSIFGEATCVIGSQSCQLLALEPGMPETFVYGPHERTFRIEVLKIHDTLTAKPRRASLGATKGHAHGKKKGKASAEGAAGSEPAPRGEHAGAEKAG